MGKYMGKYMGENPGILLRRNRVYLLHGNGVFLENC